MNQINDWEKEMMSYDSCKKHDSDYEQIIECNDCAIYPNSHWIELIKQAKAEELERCVGGNR